MITGSSSIQYKFLDPTGNYQVTTVNFSSFNVKTNFGCPNIIEYSATQGLPTSIVLPNGQTYTFTYEPTPGYSGYYTGRVKKVTLPTGGSYEYDYTGANDGISCSDGSTLGMNEVVSDGTNSATWKYVRSGGTTTITTPQLADTPNANDTVITFTGSQATQTKIYKESPGVNVLRTINTTWATNGTPATRVTILEDGTTQSEVDTTYDSNGLLDSVSEYDWGSGTHGALLRTTTFTYQTATNYTSRNIIGLVTSKQIKDGSGTTQYRQDIAYDGVALGNCPTGVPQHNDSSYGCTFNYRGNPTAITTYLAPATPANGITKNFTYDFFGNLLTAQLNCCQNKTWTYSSATQYSLPDSITSGTSPTQLTTSASYNAYTGQVATSTDENNLVTHFSYDTLRRPTQVWQTFNSSNVGSTVSYSYDDTHFTATTTTTIDAAKSVQQIAALDTLGRPNLSTTEDVGNNVISKVGAQYDLAGRAYQASNPYTGTSTTYWTTTQFDVLGRPISVTLPSPDSSVTTYSYSANTATVTDPTGKQRKFQADGAGRQLTVWEPDPSTNNTLTLPTSSTYNVLDELTQIAQGSQTRTFVYDALGRLLSAATPESGRVCFGSVTGSTCNTDGYDSFDNLMKRTDARGVLTSYGYDTLNRLTSASYNVSGATGVPSTASISLTYGAIPAQFNNGRLITMTDGVGSENYTYNVSRLARFSSPDPIAGSTSDPQSLNRYSYVRNMPVIFTDPQGTCPPTVQNRDSDGSQSTEWTGGPSAEINEAASPEPQAQPCTGTMWNYWSYFGVGMNLDGGWNGDDSGYGYGFSVGSSGGGIMGGNDPWGLMYLRIWGPKYLSEEWGTDVYLGTGLFFPLSVGSGSSADNFKDGLYGNATYAKALDDCVKKVFSWDYKNGKVPDQNLGNSPALNVSKTGNQLLKMCSGADKTVGCNVAPPEGGSNGTIYIASEKFNNPNALVDNYGSYVHELGNILDARAYPQTPTGPYPYESHHSGASSLLGDTDTGANLEDCFLRAIGARK